MRPGFVTAMVAILWAASASATETGKCDAKPFTLKKPAPAAPAVAPTPPPATKTASTQPPRNAAPSAKPKYVIGCKQPASKNG